MFFIPTKDIYGSLYPLIHLSFNRKKKLIFQLAERQLGILHIQNITKGPYQDRVEFISCWEGVLKLETRNIENDTHEASSLISP